MYLAKVYVNFRLYVVVRGMGILCVVCACYLGMLCGTDIGDVKAGLETAFLHIH